MIPTSVCLIQVQEETKEDDSNFNKSNTFEGKEESEHNAFEQKEELESDID